MERKQLGGSDLILTPVGIGAWAMGGGGWQFAWGPQEDAASIAAIRAALDGGVNWIDTAPVYGLGHSEEVVARALDGVGRRPYVFTKCSRIWDEEGRIHKSLKAASIRQECEASLRRLKVEVIDLYQMHWPEPEEDVEEGWETMIRLKEEGKVRWIGVSNFTIAQLRGAQALAPVTSLQPPYSIISPEVEEAILPHCAASGVGVIVYSPMKSGLLTGAMTRNRIAAMPKDDFRRNALNYQEPHLTRNLAMQEKCREIGARHGRNAGEVAIAWTLRNPAVTAAIVGLRSPEQWLGVAGALEFRLTAGEIQEIADYRHQLLGGG